MKYQRMNIYQRMMNDERSNVNEIVDYEVNVSEVKALDIMKCNHFELIMNIQRLEFLQLEGKCAE